MGRANNTARSLQIISKQQGWDPNEIVGETTFPREDIFKSVTGPIPGGAADPQSACPDTEAGTKPSFHTPVLRENEDHGKTQPFSRYKPGAGRQ
jgi:hypothetical protein